VKTDEFAQRTGKISRSAALLAKIASVRRTLALDTCSFPFQATPFDCFSKILKKCFWVQRGVNINEIRVRQIYHVRYNVIFFSDLDSIPLP